jgi:hypothetical protein
VSPHFASLNNELFGADESNSVPDFADHAVQDYRGVDWRTD